MQIMSITETQWSGSSVIIISPDSDCLSVLQAAVLGTDLRNHAQVVKLDLQASAGHIRGADKRNESWSVNVLT